MDYVPDVDILFNVQTTDRIFLNIKTFFYAGAVAYIYFIVLIESLNPISIDLRWGCGGWNGRILCVNNGLEREQNGNNQAIKVSSLLRLPRIQLIISRHQSGRLLR